MNNDFGKFIKERRQAVGLTQQELADKLFVSSSAVSKWESNRANPDISMIDELSKILKVSEHELILASIDVCERKTKSDAKKWRKLSLTWNLFFIISYAVTLLTCFICNLAVNKTLSWFFIVFFSLVLAMSFTTFPRYIKKYKLILNSLIELSSLIVLLLFCNFYCNGEWFLLAIIPILFSFVLVFVPLYISKYNLPRFIKKNNAILSLLLDYVFLLLMLFVICYKTNGNWLISFAIPISLIVFVFSIIFAFICIYIKIPKLIKSSILTFLFLPFIIVSYFSVKKLCLNQFNILIDEITFPNLLNWSNDVLISSNIFAIIILLVLLTSLVFLIIYLIKRNIKNK